MRKFQIRILPIFPEGKKNFSKSFQIDFGDKWNFFLNQKEFILEQVEQRKSTEISNEEKLEDMRCQKLRFFKRTEKKMKANIITK